MTSLIAEMGEYNEPEQPVRPEALLGGPRNVERSTKSRLVRRYLPRLPVHCAHLRTIFPRALEGSGLASGMG